MWLAYGAPYIGPIPENCYFEVYCAGKGAGMRTGGRGATEVFFVSGVLVPFAAVPQALMISADPVFKGTRVVHFFYCRGESRTSISEKQASKPRYQHSHFERTPASRNGAQSASVRT